MAVTNSGLFLPNWIDFFDASALTPRWDLATHKIALFKNSITPNFSSDTAYAVAPYLADAGTSEVAGTGYTAGGALLGTLAPSESPAGTLMFDASDTSWTTSTIANARCALVYYDALAGNNAFGLINFGNDYSTSAGTFTIQYASTGLFAIDLTP